MGVRGLQTFVKDNRQSLCRSIQLRQDGSSQAEKTVIVVDAVIYQLYLSSLPWQSGGEYLRFYRIVRRLIDAWRSVGLEPYFVFDGASPPEKHDTLISRLQQQIGTARLFYTTSAASRSGPSFSRSEVLLPPLASHAFIFALSELQVRMHFVPMGEADGMCVAIAEQMAGFVLGQDSDYLILAGGEGLRRMRGYVPIDMIMWIEGDEGRWDDHTGGNSRGTGWNVAQGGQRGKEPWQPRQPPLLPPADYRNPVLVLTYVPPIALRQRLRLPASVSPMFASLAGNDYTPPAAGDLFFEPGLRATAKIEKVARTLREQVYHPNAQALKATNPGDQAVELVRRVVKKLLIRPLSSEAELQDLVEAIIEASFQYTLPLGTDCCDQYPFCGELDPSGCQTPLSRGTSRPGSRAASSSNGNAEEPPDPNVAATSAYAAAQRRGLAGSVTQLWLYPHRMYLWSVLEDPQQAAFKTTTGLKALRRDAFAIAAEGFGSLRWEQAAASTPEAAAGDHNMDGEGRRSEDEVAQSPEHERMNPMGIADANADSRPASAGGDDQTLVGSEADLSVSKGAISPTPGPVKRVVTEYVRQGSRILPNIHDLGVPGARAGIPPACLDTLDKRLATYLRSLHSDTPAILALSAHIQPWVAIVRFCAIECARKSQQHSTDGAKWRRAEVEAVLRAGIGSYAQWEKEWSLKDGGKKARKAEPVSEGLYPLLSTRNATLVSQITATMTDTIYLAQALLLLPDAQSAEHGQHRLTHLIPFVFVSGVTLHTLLSGSEPTESPVWKWTEGEQQMFERCLSAFGQYMDEDVVFGWQDGARHEGEHVRGQPDDNEPASPSASHKKRKSKKKAPQSGSISGRFGLLQELAAE